MTRPALYSMVVLVTDRFAHVGVRCGLAGYVIDHYPDGTFDVEFSDEASGETIAIVTASAGDVEPGRAG